MKTMPATQVAGIFIMVCVRGDSRDQGTLFPVSLDELVPGGDHVCRVVDTFVESLNLVRRAVRKKFGCDADKPLTALGDRKTQAGFPGFGSV
jgi:hypothetical protein